MDKIPTKKKKVKSPLLDRATVAELLNIDKQTVAYKAKLGLLKREYIGQKEVYPAHLNGLEAYIEIVE